jgi:hypothetical protein
MKRVLLFSVIFVLCVGLLSACQVTYPVSESDSYFERTIELLSNGDIKAAKKLNCVDKGIATEAEFQFISEHLDSRKVISFKKTSSEISNRYSTGGPVVRETAAYEVTLDDGAVVVLWTEYIDGHGVKGITSIELQVD